MSRRILTVAALLAALARPTMVAAHDNCVRLECQKTKQKIAKIESKMRRGYTVSAGEKMKDELRRLRRLRARICR